jgi:hypothetical protein
VTIGKGLNWVESGLDSSVRGLALPVDKDNNLFCIPTVAFDIAGNGAMSLSTRYIAAYNPLTVAIPGIAAYTILTIPVGHIYHVLSLSVDTQNAGNTINQLLLNGADIVTFGAVRQNQSIYFPGGMSLGPGILAVNVNAFVAPSVMLGIITYYDETLQP